MVIFVSKPGDNETLRIIPRENLLISSTQFRQISAYIGRGKKPADNDIKYYDKDGNYYSFKNTPGSTRYAGKLLAVADEVDPLNELYEAFDNGHVKEAHRLLFQYRDSEIPYITVQLHERFMMCGKSIKFKKTLHRMSELMRPTQLKMAN